MPKTLEHYDMVIRADGTWIHNGRPIRRAPLVKLFSTVLKRDGEGIYWLETPAEYGRITVEDLPFVAVDMAVSDRKGAAQTLSFITNTGDTVTAGNDHPVRFDNAGQGVYKPAVYIRDGLWARVNRAVYYDMMDLLEVSPATGHTGIRSNGEFFCITDSDIPVMP